MCRTPNCRTSACLCVQHKVYNAIPLKTGRLLESSNTNLTNIDTLAQQDLQGALQFLLLPAPSPAEHAQRRCRERTTILPRMRLSSF